MKTQDKTQLRLNNYREALSGLVKSSQSTKTRLDFTDWHKKQIAVLEAKITELEWILSEGCETADKIKAMKTPSESFVFEFLEAGQLYQKDGTGIYYYTSENDKHGLNLMALLDDYHSFLVAKQIAKNYRQTKNL
jgi:hypothetical protein